VKGNIIRIKPYEGEGDLPRDRWVRTRRAVKDVKSYSDRINLLSFAIHVIARNGFNPAAWNLLKRVHLVCFTTHIDNLRKMVGKLARECGFVYDSRKPRAVFTLPKFRLAKAETKTFIKEGVTLPLYELRDFSLKEKDWS